MTLLDGKAYSDEQRWICIYPAYLNVKKTVAEGRRVKKEKAVDNPTCQEIHDILKTSGFNVKIEKKMYSRDPTRDLQHQGRVRVQLKLDDGTPINKEFPNRAAMLLYVAEMIPKLKSRQGKVPSGATSNQPGTQPGLTPGGQQGAQGGKKKKKR